jgi:lysine biosynthesis protein LysW
MTSVCCPECGQVFDLREPSEGQQVVCPHCQTRLEVLNLEPLELDWSYIEPHLLDVREEIEV